MIDALVWSFLCAALVAVGWISSIDKSDAARLASGAQPLPSARQIRAWRKERLVLATKNRRRK